MDNNTSEKIIETPVATAPTLEMRRGKTLFLVALHFSDQGKDTLENMIKRLISIDVEKQSY